MTKKKEKIKKKHLKRIKRILDHGTPFLIFMAACNVMLDHIRELNDELKQEEE